MTSHLPSSPVSFRVHVLRLPRKGMPVVVEADAAQRAALAAEHGLLSVERYRAEMDVAHWKRQGVRVTGRVEADITQQCVVSLDPLAASIDETFEQIYVPEDSKLGREGFTADGEIHLDAEGPDSPETFTGDTIDVGALAEEHFGLAIDPYPRKPGEAIAAAPGVGEEDDADTPDWKRKLGSLAPKP